MKTILVPTDFSANALNAMKYAIKLAEKLDSKLIFFHSTHIPLKVELFGIPPSEMRKMEIKNADEKTALLDITLNKLYRQLHLVRDASRTQMIVKNELLVVEDIIVAAHRSKAEMIVMGTHGASGISKIFGSTTSILISKSEIPVLAIPSKFRFREIRKVLYASDLKNPVSELKRILPLARSLNAVIDVFNLCYHESGDEEKLFRKLETTSKYDQLRLVQLKRNPGETVFEQLREFLNYSRPDWVVMFPEKKSLFEYIFEGSKTEKLSYNLKMPLLSVRKKLAS